MKLLLDSGLPEEIEEIKATGMLAGVTTNPKIYGTLGTDFLKRLDDILAVAPGCVFTQVVGWHNTEDMIKQARWLSAKSKKIIVKLPMSIEGLQALKCLKKDNNPDMRLAVSVVSSITQALLAGQAGADVVALFNGALDTTSDTPVHIVEPVKKMYRHYGYQTEILSCGRFPRGVGEFAIAGSDYCTLGAEFFRMLFEHPYTYMRMKGFAEDWQGAFGDKTWPTE
ncbi:transaldolase family protein [Planctomycetota bacterium]